MLVKRPHASRGTPVEAKVEGGSTERCWWLANGEHQSACSHGASTPRMAIMGPTPCPHKTTPKQTPAAPDTQHNAAGPTSRLAANCSTSSTAPGGPGVCQVGRCGRQAHQQRGQVHWQFGVRSLRQLAPIRGCNSIHAAACRSSGQGQVSWVQVPGHPITQSVPRCA